jgi:hypothetical protein
MLHAAARGTPDRRLKRFLDVQLRIWHGYRAVAGEREHIARCRAGCALESGTRLIGTHHHALRARRAIFVPASVLGVAAC